MKATQSFGCLMSTYDAAGGKVKPVADSSELTMIRA